MSSRRRNNTDDFIVQGSILAGAAVLTKVIGALYRIPLTRILGDFGMGIYSAAFEVYALALIFSTFSYPIVVSKLVSGQISIGRRRNGHRVFIFALIFSSVVGLLWASLIFFNADFIATTLFGSPLSGNALRMLSPSLLIVAIMGVFRGYFQGMGTMIPTGISQVIEQIFNGLVSIIGAIILIGVGIRAAEGLNNLDETYPLSYGAMGATMGTVAGALAGLVFLLIAYFLYSKSLKRQLKTDLTKGGDSYNRIAMVFMMTVAPVMFTTAVYNINNLLDLALFSNIMRVQGYETYTYMTLQGIYMGRYMVLINIPLAMANGLAACVIPSLAGEVARKKVKNIHEKIGQIIRLTTLVAIPCFVAYVVLASPLIIFVFGEPSPEAVTMLSIGAVTVVLYSLATVTNSILQGLNKVNLPAINATIALGVHIVAILVMLVVLRWGIYSLVVSNIIFAFTMCGLNMRAIKKHTAFRQDVEKTYIKPLVAAIVMGIVIYLIYLLASVITEGDTIPMVIIIPIAVIVYLYVALKIGTLSEEDILQLPMGERLLKVARITRALHY